MKEYTKPSMEVVEITAEDVIQTSGLNHEQNGDMTGGGAGAGWGTPANMF